MLSRVEILKKSICNSFKGLYRSSSPSSILSSSSNIKTNMSEDNKIEKHPIPNQQEVQILNDLESEYSRWSKKSLIKKILQLEGKVSDDQIIDMKKKKTKQKQFDFSKHTKRHVGLKFSYLGWNYQGLAIQKGATELPTVEFKIMQALEKLKLVPSLKPTDCNFSRCGRTDRGVSAMNQVISLNIRSKLTEEELKDPENDEKELDYIHMLNKVLPPDIRFHSICLRPPQGFDARFSCTYRHYKYIFSGDGLDIDIMLESARLFLGEQDFRNFCKLDPSKQLTAFFRRVDFVNITPFEGKPGYYVFDLIGSAFLWHQVRCMMAVLFAVGQKLEKPDIITRLLNPIEFPARPIYKMAHEFPLVLYDCGFGDDIKWTTGSQRLPNKHEYFEITYQDYQIKAAMAQIMKEIYYSKIPPNDSNERVMIGRGEYEGFKAYIPLEKRKTLDTFDVINEKWREKKRTFSEMDKEETIEL